MELFGPTHSCLVYRFVLSTTGDHTDIGRSDFLSGSMQIHFVNSLFSESILVVDQGLTCFAFLLIVADIDLGSYTFDTVLPTGF
jgi:hypothetical protein